MTEAKVYGSLEDLVRSEAMVMADPEKGPKVYRVKSGGKEKFAAAASPGQAALGCVEVELVPRRNLLATALQALAKADGSEEGS